eukprot:TRINITY_DN66943_c10_g3_i1.p1 TRINITY_DN66943_c10_g3~~TRINITY_DN66943_c10_g3_i1.p1  ORF type:complete len:237 (-),score=25.09 TRINITY_DN66943_c10_g3_i1:61-771(-)
MLRSGQWSPDEADGRYFLDRSPKRFSVILDYLRDGKMLNWENLSADEACNIRTELDFYQIPFPEVPTPLPTLIWNTKRVLWGDGTTTTAKAAGLELASDNRLLSITAAASSQCRAVNSIKFSKADTVTFSLKTTRLAKCGTLYFPPTKNGLNLGTGLWTDNDGSSWDDCFPSLEEDFDYKGMVVHEFRFKLNLSGKSPSVTVTWPTGSTRILQLSKPPTQLQLSITNVSSGMFELQ